MNLKNIYIYIYIYIYNLSGFYTMFAQEKDKDDTRKNYKNFLTSIFFIKESTENTKSIVQ